jgi:surface antigen
LHKRGYCGGLPENKVWEKTLMHRRQQIMLVIAAAMPLLTACQNNEQTGGLLGALGGGALGCATGQLIGHSAAGTAIGCAGGALAGYFAGSAIGRQLDERDREKALAATQQALYVPVSYSPGSTRTIHPRTKPVSWTSDHNPGVRGSSTLVAVEPKSDGGECRIVRDIAYVKGQEVQQQTRECRTANGSFVEQGST